MSKKQRLIAFSLIVSLFSGIQQTQIPSVIKAEEVTEQVTTDYFTQQNQNVTSGSSIDTITTTQDETLNDLDLPVKTEQITMQLQCKKDTYKELEVNLDEHVQSVLTGAGITVVSWRIASGSGVVSLEKITPNKAGKTTAKIKGHKAGKATMECYVEDEQGKFYVLGRFNIRVLTAKTEVSFAKKQYTVPYSWYKTIKASVVSPNNETVKLTYSSSNKKVATVDQNGKVTGVSVGTATITAKANDGSKVTDSYQVKVEKEKKGWHITSSGKKYYVKKDGTRAKGYFKVGDNYYYGNSSSYMATKSWKYVKVGGKKYKLYFGKTGKQSQDVSSVIGKQSKYQIEVNISTNTVIVYAKDGKNGFIIPVKAMVCSCGVSGHSTITGNYSNLRRAGKWHTLYYGTYGKYCTRISGPYLFHSVVYSKNGDSYSLQADEYDKLGKLASHGCIRLSVKDAKWIYQNYSKCSVKLFRSSKKAPLKKPTPEKAVRLENGKAYDPTDADIKS